MLTLALATPQTYPIGSFGGPGGGFPFGASLASAGDADADGIGFVVDPGPALLPGATTAGLQLVIL
ncbi:MAG TPA: hypothetical protein VFI25_16810 [Planctomycetota bacterium]|nr:hypothetical protein [Planctomycetota bacterium]